ncbi:uncharacterized protein LOC144994750 isoform X1 [Oryzias latipes]
MLSYLSPGNLSHEWSPTAAVIRTPLLVCSLHPHHEPLPNQLPHETDPRCRLQTRTSSSTSDATSRSYILGPPVTVTYLSGHHIKSTFSPRHLCPVSHSGFQHLGLSRSIVMTERTGHNPDPADPEGLRLAVSQQGILLGRQADALSQMAAAQQDLFHRLDGLTQTLNNLTGHFSHVPTDTAQATANSATSVSGSPSAHENIRLQPEPFTGDVEACGGFLLQCELIYQQAPRHYQSDHSKISLIVNSLRNKALQWAQAFLSSNPISHLTYERFLREFQLIFDQPRKQDEATRRLLALRQRNRSPGHLRNWFLRHSALMFACGSVKGNEGPFSSVPQPLHPPTSHTLFTPPLSTPSAPLDLQTSLCRLDTLDCLKRNAADGAWRGPVSIAEQRATLTSPARFV